MTNFYICSQSSRVTTSSFWRRRHRTFATTVSSARTFIGSSVGPEVCRCWCRACCMHQLLLAPPNPTRNPRGECADNWPTQGTDSISLCSSSCKKARRAQKQRPHVPCPAHNCQRTPMLSASINTVLAHYATNAHPPVLNDPGQPLQSSATTAPRPSPANKQLFRPVCFKAGSSHKPAAHPMAVRGGLALL